MNPDTPSPSEPPAPLLGTAYPPGDDQEEDEPDDDPADDEEDLQAEEREARDRAAAAIDASRLAPGVEIYPPVGGVRGPRIALGLRRGHRGHDVRVLQQALRAAGWEGRPDAYFGRLTEAGLSRFQLERGLAVTGELDEATAEALGLA